MDEYAVFFENGAWVIRAQDEFGNVVMREIAPSFEEAIQAVSMLTGASVGIKLITKQR